MGKYEYVSIEVLARVFTGLGCTLIVEIGSEERR